MRRKKLNYPSGRVFMYLYEYGDTLGRMELLPADPWEEDKAWLVRNLEVDPTYRRQGIGRLIGEKAIRDFGHIDWVCNVQKENPHLLSAYQDAGFYIVDETATAYKLRRDPEDREARDAYMLATGKVMKSEQIMQELDDISDPRGTFDEEEAEDTREG